MRERVLVARRRMWPRQGVVNARLDAAGVAEHMVLARPKREMLNRAIEQWSLSGCARERIINLAVGDRCGQPGRGGRLPQP
ncbi:hypothetical protein [Guyparkeria sp.]|uniref:magnesium chelatase subunit ChlI family protein n=1 Tax=Guyparkeria sp. TaxID=2035736 RepID=UPI003970E262